MNQFLKKYFCLSIVLLLTLNVQKGKAQDSIPANGRAIINLVKGTPVLYHASFKVLKYTFTGLIVFKSISEEEGVRIVFLSETGLSIAEFSMLNNNITCLSTLPVVDRKGAKKYLSKIIHQVLTPSTCKKIKIKQKSDDLKYICKGKNGKHCYIYTSGNLQEIIYKSSICKKSVACCTKEGFAENILIQKRNKTKVKLKKVENAFK
jgi:hypothetical protein